MLRAILLNSFIQLKFSKFKVSVRIWKCMWLCGLTEKIGRKFTAAIDNAEIAQTSLHIKIKWLTNDV